MKLFNTQHFEQNKYTKRFIFFVEVMNECLFDYSFESYRVPSLNSHFLCYDIYRTADDINNKVLLDGNFVPLSEEFEYNLKNDIFITDYFDDRKTLTLMMGKNGVYIDLTKNDLKSKIKYYPEIAKFIIDLCESNNTYLNSLYNLLIKNIFDEEEKEEHFFSIYNLTRDLACELMNIGYSKYHLYTSIGQSFLAGNHQVLCNEKTLIEFFNSFSLENQKFSVSFGLNTKMANLFRGIENVSIEKSTAENLKLLNIRHQNSYLATIIIESLDKYSAYSIAKEFFGAIVSFHSLNQHQSKLFVSDRAIVSQLEGDNIIETEIINVSQNLMLKKGNISYEQSIILDISIISRESTPESFYKAVSLHNDAVESKKTSNQLLNLWTVLEILINTKRDNEDRINTICNVLCSVLTRCYLYSLISQLNKDIKMCYKENYEEILKSCEFSNTNLDDVQKLAILLSVKNFENNLNDLINVVDDHPLLSYRINQFHTKILVNSKSIFDFIMKHKKRIRWHIMRIYRNRNMIVHNGSYMPYLDTITENLHYYVDILIDTLIDYYNFGFEDNNSIYKDIFNEETLYFMKLGCTDLTKKLTIKDAVEITEENVFSLVFNDYFGNSTQKAIKEVVERNKCAFININ